MTTNVFKSEIIGESYTEVVLENGLRVFVYEKPDFDSSYAVFGTKYGSIDTAFSLDDGDVVNVPEGIAHFLEHKLFESEDGDAFTKYAATGAYANAFTSFDRTCYLFSCSNLFEKNLDILLDFVQNPFFTQQTVLKEQGIIGQEIRMYDDTPSWCVLFNLLEAMYHKHPVRIDIAGTVDSISKIDDKLLYKCYNTFYDPSNMFVCVCGNIDADAVTEKIKNGVRQSNCSEIKRYDAVEPESVVRSYVEKQLEVSIPLFCYGYKQPVSAEVTLYDSVCVNLLLKVLSDDASPLYKKLTDAGLINDEFDAEYFTGRGYAAILFDGESWDPRAVADAINSEVLRLKKDGIDEELFEAVRRDAYGLAIKRFDSVNGISMMLVDGAIHNYNIYDELEIIKSLTVQDISKYLRYFNADKSVLSVIKKGC